MTDDYKDEMNCQKKYPGASKCMRDIYELLNMDYINYSPGKDNAKSNKSAK
jgi:hypothetical protein